MRQRVWIAFALASFGWGTGGVATRAAFDEGLEPYALSAMRVGVAAVLVLTYLAVARRPFPRGRVVWQVGVVMGVANLAVPFILFTIAYQYASAGFVGLLAALIPLVTALWAHVLLPDEPLTGAKLIGLSIALAGSAVILASGESGIGDDGRPALAFGLGVGAVLMIGFAGAYAKKHAGRYQPMAATGAQFIVGTAVLLVATPLVEGIPDRLNVAGTALVAYMAAFSTFLPFAMFFWLLTRVTITQAALIGYIVPLVAVVTGIVLLDERFPPGLAVGGALILAGVILTDRLSQPAVRPLRTRA